MIFLRKLWLFFTITDSAEIRVLSESAMRESGEIFSRRECRDEETNRSPVYGSGSWVEQLKRGGSRANRGGGKLNRLS